MEEIFEMFQSFLYNNLLVYEKSPVIWISSSAGFKSINFPIQGQFTKLKPDNIFPM